MKTKSKTKEYSYDSEGHIKYWFNPNRRSWEVYDCLKGDWLVAKFYFEIVENP